jgi:dipeptidyl aminopeptidase/acylaminoacyl peptidase
LVFFHLLSVNYCKNFDFFETQMKKLLFVLVAFWAASTSTFAQGAYQKPPKEIMDVLNAPAIPATSISPTRDRILIAEPLRYPPIAELAQPMLRLAGLRINPNNTAQHRTPYFVKLSLKTIADGKETAVQLPAGAQIVSPAWSADGKYIAAGNLTPGAVELWIIETATGRATKISNAAVNTAFGGFSWMPDNRSLLVNLVQKARTTAPAYQNLTPNEPSIQETSGKAGAVQTFQDLLKNPNDEKLFDYYATSQLAAVSVDGKVREIGQPAIFEAAEIAPDGNHILVARIQKPYSYLYPFSRFPREVEIWDANGKMVHKLASLPLQDQIPVDGVATGARSYGWHPVEPATAVWVEALDGGNPKEKVSARDRILKLAAPFNSQPVEIAKIEHRYQGRAFGERDGLMLFYDYNRDTRRRRMFAMNFANPAEAPRMISDLNVADRYNDIGAPVAKTLANGKNAIRMNGDEIFLTAAGATPSGERPFLRRMNLKTKETNEIFRSGEDAYESFVALTSDDGSQFITRKESISEPPNLLLRDTVRRIAPRSLTNFPDPAPQLRGIKKQLVKYKRADGVDLSFTLYTPPNYKEGTRLPTVVWAYPLEFTDASVAGQVTGSTTRFTQIGAYSHLFFLLNGYAVLDDATMPIVGAPETVNDTFVKQIVDSAKAAIDKGVEMGVVDAERVGVGGHSYGAFMTANLLAHSDLFRAGIARSGAYNRTLTPFGFQGERRTFWEATKLYTDISPFFYANKINEPVLLIHGEADNNQGTFPIQSERLFAAIRGTGGTARLVMLPLESHGYAARESIEHTLFEMLAWFDKHVKNAPPKQMAKQQQ